MNARVVHGLIGHTRAHSTISNNRNMSAPIGPLMLALLLGPKRHTKGGRN